jgi:hypothetical protein
MATSIASIITTARSHLNETVEKFWFDYELADLAEKGIHDLWRAINDNFQHYFVTIDETNVSQPAGSAVLVGVPDDVAIVRGLEARDLSLRPGLVYEHKDYNHVDFQRARSRGTLDPSYAHVYPIYYCIMGAGAPVGAPTIQVAPVFSAPVLLRLTYVPTLPLIDEDSLNPIPGESDQALVAWVVAYALAKEQDDKTPHAGWLAIYGTEKTNMLTSLTPRQTDDETYVEALFEDLW